MRIPIDLIFVYPEYSIRRCIEIINQGGVSIALVVNEQRKLLGTITDGDIRRAILGGLSLDSQVSELLARKSLTPYAYPVVAKAGTDANTLLRLMQDRSVRQVPLLDESNHVIDLMTLMELLPTSSLPVQAVIMAGGFGTRLHPLTHDLPKPMLPIGDRPMMQVLIEQLSQAGIKQVHVTTHYLADKITDYFGDGQRFGVEINYVSEEKSLGTAGGLGLMSMLDTPFLIINGDILTDVDFRAMFAFHIEHHADLTMAVRQYEMQVPYGVIQTDGWRVLSVVEKPTHNVFVNAGIYLMQPDVQKLVPPDEKFDMTDLIQMLLDRGRNVVSFPVWEYWRDIGQLADYEQAQTDVKNGKLRK